SAPDVFWASSIAIPSHHAWPGGHRFPVWLVVRRSRQPSARLSRHGVRLVRRRSAHRGRAALIRLRGLQRRSRRPSLLRTQTKRPRSRCATEERDEVAAGHSITSSARASSVGGTSSPRAFAVFRLITSSYLVGAC